MCESGANAWMKGRESNELIIEEGEGVYDY